MTNPEASREPSEYYFCRKCNDYFHITYKKDFPNYVPKHCGTEDNYNLQIAEVIFYLNRQKETREAASKLMMLLQT